MARSFSKMISIQDSSLLQDRTKYDMKVVSSVLYDDIKCLMPSNVHHSGQGTSLPFLNVLLSLQLIRVSCFHQGVINDASDLEKLGPDFQEQYQHRAQNIFEDGWEG